MGQEKQGSDFRDQIELIITNFTNLRSEDAKILSEYLATKKLERVFTHLKSSVHSKVKKRFQNNFQSILNKTKILEELIAKNTIPMDEIQWRPTDNPWQVMRSSASQEKKRYIFELINLIENKKENDQILKEKVIKQRQKSEQLMKELDTIHQVSSDKINENNELLLLLLGTHKKKLNL